VVGKVCHGREKEDRRRLAGVGNLTDVGYYSAMKWLEMLPEI
jgi:hypothetical protein